MVDLASIRNASFSLTPTGYNPEEVDQFLADLADQLSEPADSSFPAAVESEPTALVIETPAPPVEAQGSGERAPADLDGLHRAVERTITSLDSFVSNELAAVKVASALEVDEIHRERERLLQEAGEAARSHLDEARQRAQRIMDQAEDESTELRRRFEAELQAERERFEQALADRDGQAQARAADIVATAEERRREADALVANADKVQSAVLASIEEARASLAVTTDARPRVHVFEAVEAPSEQRLHDPWARDVEPPAERLSLESIFTDDDDSEPEEPGTQESDPSTGPDDATDAAA
jgi:DivIVA domain-containing protein